MKNFLNILMIAVLSGIALFAGCANETAKVQTDTASAEMQAEQPVHLAVLWTSGDPYVAHKVCFMYTSNAKSQGWFDRVQLIVWGPSAKLLAEDAAIQSGVKDMMAVGVEVKACKACADSYGVSDTLSGLGIEVKYMGRPLTEFLKAPDWATLTF